MGRHLEHEQALTLLAERTAAFTASVTGADPQAGVPTCSGWTVEKLTTHLGRVHLWAAAAVGRTTPPGRTSGGDRGGQSLSDWYAACAVRLQEALAAVPDDQPAWSFSRAHQVASFWPRRQVHETTVHLLDLQLATGELVAEPPGPSPAWLEPEVAVDGVDEVLTVFLQRGLDRRAEEPDLVLVPPTPALTVAATDGPAWTVRVDGDVATVTDGADPEAMATVSAPATHLYLSLWGRANRSALTIEGDRAVAEQFMSAPLTP